MSQLKIEKFVEDNFGIKLTTYQLELIAAMAADPEDRVVMHGGGGKQAGKTTAMKSALAYLQDGMKPIVDDAVTRFEVIDHRQCVYCRGRKTANYVQPGGAVKELLCDKCEGSGMRGGRVYGAFSNPETSNIKVELSYQDDGKTLKVFVSDREATE